MIKTCLLKIGAPLDFSGKPGRPRSALTGNGTDTR